MLDAWIKKKDVINLLSESESIDGMVDRMTFIRGINKIKGSKKPKPKSTKKYFVNNSFDRRNDIRKYWNKVALQNSKSFFYQWKREYKDDIRSDVKFVLGYWMMNDDRMDDEMYCLKNIIPIGDLEKIINVSKRTLYRWEEKGLLNREKDRRTGLEFYDLSELMKCLKS